MKTQKAKDINAQTTHVDGVKLSQTWMGQLRNASHWGYNGQHSENDNSPTWDKVCELPPIGK